MSLIGYLLIVLGLILQSRIAYSVGIVMLLVGIALAVMGALGVRILGRKHWW